MKYVTVEDIQRTLDSEVGESGSESFNDAGLPERENGMTCELREAIRDEERFKHYVVNAGLSAE